MPVVSMSAQANAQVQQMQQQIQNSLPLQSNLAVTEQPMQMNMQQLQQLQQMAPHGTIIGQIQSSQPQPTAIPQVTASPTHLQQMQAGVPQSIAIQPQQIALPPTIVPPHEIKREANSTENVQNASALAETDKEVDATSSQPDSKEPPPTVETKPLVNGVEPMVVQPAPIPGTVPSQPSTAGSENGLPVAATAEEVKERCPPKAMVKPRILNHVIGDFVIQESSEPFPVTRSSLLGDIKPTQSSNDKDCDELAKKKRAVSPGYGVSLGNKGEMAKCEACGTFDLKVKFKKNKRFCSLACSKSGKYKSDDKKKWDKEGMEVDTESGTSGAESSLSPKEDDTPKIDPSKWNVQEVFNFIKGLPAGGAEYAEGFLIQEIDGQALMLLKEDHLMTAMAMKLGPALEILAKIEDMRIDKEPPEQS